MWADESVFYQIYPLGFCGVPKENDGIVVPRLERIADWLPHLKRLQVSAVYFSPVFESDRHGYDTRDFRKIDCRLGTNETFAKVCAQLHENGIRVVLDGVFNHVGRGFWAFQDVLRNREQSRYRDWFYINFAGDSCYQDGLWYEGWEGHFELVKLNLKNPEVVSHLFESIRLWVEEFQIDGLRLDVAYCLELEFLRQLRQFCDALKPEFFLLGEMLFGDYNQRVNEQMLHSCTNYECRKGLYSSFNDLNLFEIAHSLQRQFGSEAHALYQGKRLLSFVDNHDVTRAASILKEKRHLPLLYGLLFGMPGIPCIYYGSEWGVLGEKEQGDDALRPMFAAPEWNALTELLAALATLRGQQRALWYGSFRTVLLTNRQLVFERAFEGERIFIAINADEQAYFARFDGKAAAGDVTELLSGERLSLREGVELPPFGLYIWKLEE